MDLNIMWTQGKCDSLAYFVTNKEICFQTGTFIKFCSIEEFSETSIQGPLENIQCICADPDLEIISIASENVYVLHYPKLDVITQWPYEKESFVIQMCFVGDNYLLTLEGPPKFNLVLWNWNSGMKLESIFHTFPIVDASTCFISVHPVFKEMFIFQQHDALHFYEVEYYHGESDLIKRTLYLPVNDDLTCSSILHDGNIEELTYFDKMHHDSWGIHSEVLHSLPLEVFVSQLTERELVTFYDFLMKQERLVVSTHCWLPEKQLLVACMNGTVLKVTLDFSMKIVTMPDKSLSKSNEDCYITCMSLNKNGLYVAEKNGKISLIQNIEEWVLIMLISIDEFPIHMKLSPDFRNILINNRNGSVIALDVTERKTDIVYVSTCSDDSSIVGIFILDDNSCVSAKYSGLIEVWNIHNGAPISQFHVRESLKCMGGCPSSSAIIVSGYNSFVYVISVCTKDLKIVESLRPSDKPVKIIRCDNFGRYAYLVSEDSLVFICSIVPSVGFMILGYVSEKYDIVDTAVFSKGACDKTHLSLLTRNKTHDSIINMTIPEDFTVNFETYWQDVSGKIKSDPFKMIRINLKINCSGIVAHLLNGLILYLPTQRRFINVAYEDLEKLRLQVDVKAIEGIGKHENCQIFLSDSHYLLISISDTSEIIVRKAHDFKISCKKKFSEFNHLVPHCSFRDNIIIVEGFKGVLTCLKSPTVQDAEEMSWTSYCRSKRKEENAFLCKIKAISKQDLSPWVTQQLNILNKEPIMELTMKRDKLKENFERIQKELEVLASENVSVPIEHQLECEEFILDENVREQLVQRRNDSIESYEKEWKEKHDKIEKGILEIKSKCLENMLEQGKILKSFRDEMPLYNYSIPILSEKEKDNIRYSFKKDQLEKCLLNLKLNESMDKNNFENEPTFEKYTNDFASDDIITKDISTFPFQLLSREERIDYTFILKYIMLRKRLAFNCRFNEAAFLRKDTVKKIRGNNSRIKEIMHLIGEDTEIWEPRYTDDEISQNEVENEMNEQENFEKNSVEQNGIADDFLTNEWLLKLKASLQQRSRIRLKKENIEILKKEIYQRSKAVAEAVDRYEKVHSQLTKDKLNSDLEINECELQLCLILFSVSNFSLFKKRELHSRKAIQMRTENVEIYGKRIEELECSINQCGKDVEYLKQKIGSLDEEAKQVSKMSKNKPAFFEAYELRPAVQLDAESLNPYKVVQKAVSDNLFKELNSEKNKPPRVPRSIWKQLCSLRETKYFLEKQIDESMCKASNLRKQQLSMKNHRESLKNIIVERKKNLQKLQEQRVRCSYETPMVHSVADPQLELKYPEDLNFKEALYLRKFHVESLNGMVANAGNDKLGIVHKSAKTEYQIEKNESKARMDTLRIRDMKNEIELAKSIPLTKDVQTIIQDPKGFSLQGKIDAFEKSKQMEMHEIAKQISQVNERISSIEVKRDILKKSTKENRKVIEKLKGDIAELRKIEKLAMSADSKPLKQ